MYFKDFTNLEKRVKFPAKLIIYPWKRWDVVCSTILLNIFGLVIPILILQLYDRVIPNQAFSTLWMLIIGAFTVVVFEAIVRFSRSHILSWLGMFFDYTMHFSAFRHLFSARYDAVMAKSAGEHVENIESIPVVREFLAGQGFLSLMDVPFVILYVLIIAYLSPLIAVVPVISLIGFVITAYILGEKLRKSLEGRMDIDNRRYSFIIQILTNHHTVKALGMEELILRRYERMQTQCSHNEYRINQLSAESRDLGQLFSYLLYGGIICVAAFEVIEGHASVGIMSASLLLANRAMQPLQGMMATWTRLQHFRIGKSRLSDLFALPLSQENQMLVKKDIKGDVVIKDLFFQYPNQTKPLLQNLSLSIKSGQMIGIYGANGVGKTTLTQIIMGLLSPNGGSVEIDSVGVQEYDFSALHKQMAFLPPKGVLFQGTIMENMTFFQKGQIEKKATELSKKLGLDSWLQRLPSGYETLINDSFFHLLPDGIQQRICLVRTLASNPKILILDEANSALDEQGDVLLQQYLHEIKGKTTVIFMTHRPSVSKNCDVSYELKDGCLTKKQKGTKEES